MPAVLNQKCDAIGILTSDHVHLFVVENLEAEITLKSVNKATLMDSCGECEIEKRSQKRINYIALIVPLR